MTGKETLCFENGFPSLKLKFHACSMKQAFYPLHKILREFDKKILLYKLSDWYLIVKPKCVNTALLLSKLEHKYNK